jgi:2-phosphosulfolactate phosphatase
MAGRHSSIAVIGAGSRGEFRQDDQMCCAWIAQYLMDSGYSAVNRETVAITERWRGLSPEAILASPSADYLLRSGQGRDLEFILTHIADLNWEFTIKGDEVVGYSPLEDEFSPSRRLPEDSKVRPSIQG